MKETSRRRSLLQLLISAIVAVAMMAAFFAVGGMGTGVRGLVAFAQHTTTTSTCKSGDGDLARSTPRHEGGHRKSATTTRTSTSTSTCSDTDAGEGDGSPNDQANDER